MEYKGRSTLLIGLFVAFILSIVFVFIILQNNAAPVSAIIFILFTLVIGVMLFVNSMQMIDQLKKHIADAAVDLTEMETNKTEEPELVTEIIAEKEIDIQKIIPDQELKLESFSEEFLRNLAGEIPIIQALLYIKNKKDDIFKCSGKYAFFSENEPTEFKSGETLPGQAVKNKSIVTLSNIPENYMMVASGLGNGNPAYLTYLPILFHGEVICLVEFATFSPIESSVIKGLSQLSEEVAESINKFIQ